MIEAVQQRPRTWVLWAVRVVFALSVLNFLVSSIASIWLGKRTGDSWWLLEALPQVSIALLAVLICWTPGSRPEGLELNVGGLITFGMIPAVALLKPLPIVIGALAVLALFVRPQRGKFIKDGPPPNMGSRRR